MKIDFSITDYIYLIPTITFSKADWKHNIKRIWICWLKFQICLYSI